MPEPFAQGALGDPPGSHCRSIAMLLWGGGDERPESAPADDSALGGQLTVRVLNRIDVDLEVFRESGGRRQGFVGLDHSERDGALDFLDNLAVDRPEVVTVQRE